MEQMSQSSNVSGNKSKMSTRTMVSLSILGAISIILVWLIHFPIMPAAPFLEYDPADVPILIGTFVFGSTYGVLLTLVVSLVQGVTVSAGSGIIGILMNTLSTGAYAFVAGSIYDKNKTSKGVLIGLVCGALAQTTIMVIMNLIVTPLFMGATLEEVMAMIVPIIIPFNLIKASANGAVTFFLFQSISKVLKAD